MVRTLLLALLAGGCIFPKAGVVPGPVDQALVDSARLGEPGVTLEQLEAGRAVFANTCGDCHSVPDLAPYSVLKWPVIAARMADKAGLTEQEKTLVTRWIVAVRETLPASP